jgi:hypothetical protein
MKNVPGRWRGAVEPARELLRYVVDPPPRTQGVQCITQALKVALRSFRDNVHGVQIRALKPSREELQQKTVIGSLIDSSGLDPLKPTFVHTGSPGYLPDRKPSRHPQGAKVLSRRQA